MTFSEYCNDSSCTDCFYHTNELNCEKKWLEEHDKQIRADAIDEFDRICEEARSHKFGVCDADFVIDVIKAKVKEQLKEQTE